VQLVRFHYKNSIYQSTNTYIKFQVTYTGQLNLTSVVKL